MTSTPEDTAIARTDAAAQRRWMIGIAITILFGSFGAVMAWLSYSHRASSPAAAPARSTPARDPASAPAPTPDPSPESPPDRERPGHGKGRPDK
ncbi:MAG: hypothetical protein JWP01_531 [Myxococcales bacterium]|nr:hypothetical protein [Myxococcales bacterium]